MIESTSEFIDIIRTVNTKGLMTSLDVESLFTSVPVNNTIDIILQYAYHTRSMAPPTIPESVMKELLRVCTTETPFKHVNGDVYKQIDGVSMGSPLGVLFANTYMSHLETNVLPTIADDDKPIVYCRYIDDIFLLVRNIKTLHSIKEKFETNSVLKFTFEIEKCKKLPYLDVHVSRPNDRLASAVYVKPTSSGECLNYKSVAPERYKTGVIKTMLHRAYLICSDWPSFHAEIKRLKQLFSNNNFPMNIVEREVRRFLDSKQDVNNHDNLIPSTIKLYYKNQMCTQYKQEENNLKSIIYDNVKPKHEHQVHLNIYYKSRQLASLFIRNNPHKRHRESRVVYEYTCNTNEDGCQPTNPSVYIGYTTTLIKQRMTTHAQNGSIKTHHATIHNHKITTTEIMESIKVRYASQDKHELQIAEALIIKAESPSINNQAEGEVRILNVF